VLVAHIGRLLAVRCCLLRPRAIASP
jgi:hypothetical protein